MRWKVLIGVGALAAATAVPAIAGGLTGHSSSVAGVGSTAVAPGLKDATLAGRVKLGAEVSLTDLANPALMATLAQNFSTVTPNTELTWDTTEPSRGDVSLSEVEAIATAAKAAGLTITGANLVWPHSGDYPSYLNGDSPAQLVADIKEHIDAVMTPLTTGIFAGEVPVWDVVNEPLSYGFSTGTVNSTDVFNETLGDQYIIDAFQDAYAVDPGAQLCLNEDAADAENARSNGLYAEVQSLLRRGAPISCVTFEGHLSADALLAPSYSAASVQANLTRFAALRNSHGQALHVQFSEVDERVYSNGVTPVTPAALELQAVTYGELMHACVAVAGCDGFTTWGVEDGDSWVGGQFNDCGQSIDDLPAGSPVSQNCGGALLFSAADAAKPAAAAVASQLGEPADVVLSRAADQLTSGSGDSSLGTAIELASPGANAQDSVGIATAGTYELSLTGVGESSPTVGLDVDGRQVCALTLAAASTTSYACTAPLAAGMHTLSVRLLNGQSSGPSAVIAALGVATRDPLTRVSSSTAGYATSAGWTFSSPGLISVPVYAEQETVGTLSLKATAGALPSTVTVAVDGVTVGSQVVVGATSVPINLPVTMTAGQHLVTITATAGTVSGLTCAVVDATDLNDVGSFHTYER
jgi:endo-1,4-beta-xylanase